MDNHIVSIKSKILLKGEDAKFFELLCDTHKKEGSFVNIKQFVEFIFMAGFTFIRGHFMGTMLANTLKNTTPIPNKDNAVEEGSIVLSRAFLNGEPAEFQIADGGRELHIRYRNGPSENAWQRIYLLKNNKPIQWKVDTI